MWKNMLVVAIALVATPVMADDLGDLSSLGTAIDLTSFEGIQDFDELIEPVGLVRGDCGDCRRFYLAPIVGASWGQMLVGGGLLDDQSLFTAGGAAGMAITRPGGQLRLEVEGRYRDGFGRNLSFPAYVGMTDNWSTLFNVWRDFSITRNFGVYGGGGIGAGGYRLASGAIFAPPVSVQGTNFAWQVGTGVIYAVSDRVTLDLGYRYYSVDAMTLPTAFAPGGLPNQFVANELLLSVRIYEPFRNLW